MYRFRDTLPINISEQTISGDLVTIENPEEMGVIDSLEVSLSPIQSLNGYDKPWSGGAGKNKLYIAPQTHVDRGITWIVNADGTVTATGTLTATNSAVSIDVTVPTGSYKFNGSGTGSASSTYYAQVVDGSNWYDPDYGNRDVNVTISSTNVKVYFVMKTSPPSGGITFKPMLRLASETDATFEPYSNICPISGRTSVETTRTGKNKLPITATTQTINGVTFTVNNDGTVTANGTATADAVFYLNKTTDPNETPAGQYWLSGITGSTQGSWTTFMIGWGNYSLYNPAGRAVSLTEAYKSQTYIKIGNGYTVNNMVFKPMIELGPTKTSYEPYNGNTYTTSLGRTVYGGTLDVVSGVLTVDKVMLEWFSSSNFGKGGATAVDEFFLRPSLAGVSGTWRDAEHIICSHAKNVESTSGVTAPYTQMGNGQPRIVFPLSMGMTLANFTTWLDEQQANGTPLQVCYMLAEPQTYQLTPQQISLLLGENHLWSDGEISVVWHKDLTKGRILPTEAVSINGQYIENVLDGYRTLYTKGRESLGAELNTYSVGTADGEKFKNKRYPARELTVGFQLIADNAEDFREKFNNLNNLLSLDEADFIFNDETDKFFSGYPIMNAEVEAGENSVKGEWKIYCAYPFKRSVDPITLTMADATVTNNTATFTIDYKGARPSRPVLRAKFAGAKSSGTSSEDGDCGFVAFMDGEENIVQLGNPDVLDLDEYASAETLINKEFVNVSDWTRTGGHTYKGTVTGSVSTSDTVDAFWNGGVGQTQSYAKPSYGSGTGLHGSILWKNTAGAVNFTLNAVHRLCVNNSNETGVFEVGAYNHSTGKMVAGFVIDKSGNGTTGVVRYIVNSKQVGTDQIDLSYYNNHFGYCNRTPVYVQQTYYDPVQQTYKVQVKTKKKKKKKKKYVTKSRIVWVARTRTVFSNWNYTQSNLNSSIEKEGAYVYIKVGNLPLRTFNVPDITQVVAHDASVYMGTYGTAMNTNMIHSLLFRRETGAVFAEQPNVFTAGDIVEADCNEATVYIYRDGSIGGHLEPQYGALGNDWEDFLLTSGTNVIRATWSDWVNPTYKPQIEIEYNEVFI